mgnify:CR=1 FL=1
MMKILMLLALTHHALCQTGVSGGQTFLTGGGCATIPGVGSPILMIANAHKFIEDNFKIQNTYSNVKYIHYSKTTSLTDNMVINYKLVFALTDYNGTKYIAVDLDQSPFGIGSTKINKFLMTPDAARIRQFIDVHFHTKNSYSCGDMKYVYSSFGNNPSSTHDYLFPGRNQNSAGLAVLSELGNQAAGSSASAPVGNSPSGAGNSSRVCVTANFISTTDFFGVRTATTPIDIVSCHPKKPAVAQILVSCNNNVVSSLQLSFNNINDEGTTMSQFVGNPTTPANSITYLELRAAFRIVFTSNASPSSLNIKTYDDKNTIIQEFNCGTGTTTPKTQIVLVTDFLGYGDVYSSANGVDGFDLVSYKA